MRYPHVKKNKSRLRPKLRLEFAKKDVAETLAGKDRLTDDAAMQLTGATIVRQVKPGDPVTMDFRQERITIETDTTTGKISRAYCG
ncbi:I78 family peptidase inhibitor [Ochrobactrum sp. SSR]|uniref:I78 family peptidase inhibitor n=1 Tax=Ochrobactrum sp. SSR TaxID=3045176 RepID=UPI0027AAE4ED|nr:I78 family peptidase inhibitor [Ochrobactrum sp. SSR]